MFLSTVISAIKTVVSLKSLVANASRITSAIFSPKTSPSKNLAEQTVDNQTTSTTNGPEESRSNRRYWPNNIQDIAFDKATHSWEDGPNKGEIHFFGRITTKDGLDSDETGNLTTATGKKAYFIGTSYHNGDSTPTTFAGDLYSATAQTTVTGMAEVFTQVTVQFLAASGKNSSGYYFDYVEDSRSIRSDVISISSLAS